MEPESRDAVSHGTAGLGSGFKDGYIVIAASQFPRSCHAGRAAADDGHTTFCFTTDRLRQEAAVQGHVRYEAFEFADFDVFAFLPRTQWPSHCFSLGQMRPQIAGKSLR